VRASSEVAPLPGIAFFDAWRVEPDMNIPSDLPSARNRPEEGNLPSPPASPRTDQARAREEEARDILAGAIKNQAEDGPSTRKAAIRAHTYLHAMVTQHGPMIQQAYNAAKEHASRSKGPHTKEANAADPAGHQPLPRELPTIPPELTSELLRCLSTLPDPWPLAKITINMESASQWVSKMGRLFFADEFVRHTVGTYTSKQLPQQEIALKAVRAALNDLELRVIEFLSEWMSYITADFKPKGANVAWNVNYVMYSSQPGWSLPCTTVPQPTPRKHQGGTVAECNGSESSSSHMV